LAWIEPWQAKPLRQHSPSPSQTTLSTVVGASLVPSFCPKQKSPCRLNHTPNGKGKNQRGVFRITHATQDVKPAEVRAEYTTRGVAFRKDNLRAGNFIASFHRVLAGRAVVELLFFRFRFLSVAQVAVWGQG
jgi:hypothetical protein